MARPIAAKLNVLESKIIYGEDSAENARWGQAKEIDRLVRDGVKQVAIAADWINGRTNEPYEPSHVSLCKQIWRRWGKLFENNSPDCPDWTSAYYTVQQHSKEIVPERQRRSEWSEAHEVRPPSTPARAKKFAENLIKQGDPEVIETIRNKLDDVNAAQSERLPESLPLDPWKSFWPAIAHGRNCARHLDDVHEHMHEDAWNQPPSVIRSIAENSTEVAGLLRDKVEFLESLADAASTSIH